MANIADRFNSLLWHDSKLRGMSIYHASADEDRLRIHLALRRSGGVAVDNVDIVFSYSSVIEGRLDLDGKRVCSDDISSASCVASSAWLEKLKKDNPYDSFDGYWHFEIYLIPPGGLINILAKDFTLEPQTPESP